MTDKATNPASSGPAGSHFEGQIGAYYLLSLLTASEPRGLPGTAIDLIEFQRAGEGRLLDDVIVRAHDMRGSPAVIEIQVKRSITFAPKDPIFREVVGQIVKASLRPDFWNSRYELAIAIARTSRKIDSPYQDVLTWARQLGDAATFMARIARPGSANPDMRTFVETFKSNLHDAGSKFDDETVWRLLRKLQILVFDFTAVGSATEELAKERAARALHPDDALRTADLWAVLIELALEIAASGGDRTRDLLIEDLVQKSFRLAGVRYQTSARKTLAEASGNALDDICDRIGDVMLTRLDHVAAVHTALDTSRYVEIRGDAGVGKSGVLKHFAEQISTEARVIVLSPERTIPNGWTAMRSVIGFDGTAREMLIDLACDGGLTIFVDNLDFFSDDKRRTVIDLVREASRIPGVDVVVTARRDFGTDEPNWLPSDAVARLGQTEAVVIGELSQIEVEELEYAAPDLAPLLADNHPARDVVRNLFRLARLASRPGNEPFPRTEVDMAEQWWKTADGKRDDAHRERARLLKALAEQALTRADPLDVSNRPAGAVNALVASETLRDMGNDRVNFRHDVFREWAIANLLHSEPTMIERLPLDRPASAALARGVELAARMTLEREESGIRWQSFIESLSRDGMNGSWRRAALLALVRSEAGSSLLTRVSSIMLADRARMLHELICTVMAVDVEPASQLLAAFGIDPEMIPPGIDIPRAAIWSRLILWLLSLEKDLPVVAIPDVVDLYTAWSSGLLGRDPLTPMLQRWLYRWLTEIESARDFETFRDRREPFGGEFTFEKIATLESNIRIGFLLFCNRTPELAVEYVRSLSKRRHSEDAVRSVLKFRGSLAQAAPMELADMTATALISEHMPDELDYRSPPKGPFKFTDHAFLPASPAQGPFFDLLTYAPQHGLPLIHRLVDHAVSFYSAGRKCGDDVITICFHDGERAFPWVQSYTWSRQGAGHHCVTSALMALEWWAHRRIEAGETFDDVLADTLGSPGSPAAYLLVAVDLLISHWPASREAAVPFLACPGLLCIDRERQMLDNLDLSDTHEKEPLGATSLAALRKRTSRQVALEQLLGRYVEVEAAELRETLTAMLQRAAERLGPPDRASTLRDPSLMGVHALNLLDLTNWRSVIVPLSDGTEITVPEYVSPESESKHLTALHEADEPRITDSNMQAALYLALGDPSRSSPEFVAAAVEWAQRLTDTPQNEDAHEEQMREQAVITAATVAMRDGNTELRTMHTDWALSVFTKIFETKEDPVHSFRSGLHHNPMAIAFVGVVHMLKDSNDVRIVRTILEVAASGNPAAAYGFGAAATTLSSIDERLPRAVLRCALMASIRPGRYGEIPEDEVEACFERCRERVSAAVHAELSWLVNDRPEPHWPAFPLETPPKRRRGILLTGGLGHHDMPARQIQRQETYAVQQAAALWLRSAASLFDIVRRPWIANIVRTYGPWTFSANGAGIDPDDDIDNPPMEWNYVYFDLLARCLHGLTSLEVEHIALTPICELPDEPFFDIITQFLRSVDAAFFNDYRLQEAIAVNIRSALTSRLAASRGWKWLVDDRSTSIETHIGPAIAALFFNDYGFAQPAKCYLLPKGLDQIDPFLPVLQRLVESGPSHFVALVTLNLLEVSPKTAHLPFMVLAATTWLKSFPDDRVFWVDHGFGHRVCAWIENVSRQEPAQIDINSSVRFDVDRLLAALISIGVSDAKRLEEALTRG